MKPSEIMPDGTKDWRENFASLAPDIAASPLPSRQLRRSTARQIAKGVASVKKARPSRGRPSKLRKLHMTAPTVQRLHTSEVFGCAND